MNIFFRTVSFVIYTMAHRKKAAEDVLFITYMVELV